MRDVMRISGLVLAVLAPAATAWGQAAAPPTPAAPQTPGAQATAQAPAAPGEVYSYNPEGRRDPFVSLVGQGDEVRAGREMPADGRESLAIAEVSVRGIVRNRNAFIAMILGPDKKTYIIHPGDKMFDGVVKAIAADAVVFAQDVNDPLSMIKQREVRKTLRTPEEGK